MRGRTTRGAGWELVANTLARRSTPADSFEIGDDSGGHRVHVPAGALFEDAVMLELADGPPETTRDLAPIGEAWRLEPAGMPLRRAVRVSFAWPGASPPVRAGIYRHGADGWTWIGGVYEPGAHRIEAETRYLGRFALFRDEVAPRVSLRAPPAHAQRFPYSRWALEASVMENGSGLDARASWFEVDGARVPTEWDPESGCLRWRPARPPARGLHRVRIVASDRAGNVERAQETWKER
jgi:hypothetical protein